MEQQPSDLLNAMIAKTDMTQMSGRYLPLGMHLCDTAAVAGFLVDEWLPEGAMGAIGLSREELKRISVFLAFVHDIGKATNAFQYTITKCIPDAAERVQGMGIPPYVDIDVSDRSFAHHTRTGAAILKMQELPPWVLSIVGAHHGQTLDCDEIPEDDDHRRVFYGKGKESLWHGIWKEILDQAFEVSGVGSNEQLPEILSQPAQMLLTGLIIMADWLSSNTAFFPLIDPEAMSLPDPYPARAVEGIGKISLPPRWQPDEAWRHDDLCRLRFHFPCGNEVQQAMQRLAAEIEAPGLFILEAPMGIGKTEAALVAAETLASRNHEGGLTFFLPSQATANTMFTRICDWAEQFAHQDSGWTERWEKLSMELAHGKAMLNDEFLNLLDRSDSIDDMPESRATSGLTAHRFFLGRKTQLLADFVVGTVDQLLMGALKQKHIMLRHLGLAGKVVIIDEIHAYDAYMNCYLDCMLSWLGAYHTPVILLSATLPGERRAELVRAYLNKKNLDGLEELKSDRSYPLLTWTDGGKVFRQTIPLSQKTRDVTIRRGIDDDVVPFLKSRLKGGGSAGVIVNTVTRAQKIASLLREAFPKAHVLLDHAQFIMPDRIGIEKQITRLLGRSSTDGHTDGLIVVGTQVLEQSLDIDFDTMVTDLCPIDLLLQRMGRLHRHASRKRPAESSLPTCLVLNADEGCLESGAVAIYGEYMLTKTARLLKDVIRLPEDIPLLVQQAYDKDTNEALSIGGDLDRLWEKQHDKDEQKRQAAQQMCIRHAPDRMGRRASTSVIDGLMSHGFDFTDAQQEASVRDGVSSVEVLVLQYGTDGLLHTISNDECDHGFLPDSMPSNEEARIILRQSLRLPYRFSTQRAIRHVIDELEQFRQTKLAEWMSSKLIGRELFLVLDEHGQTTLNNVTIRYSRNDGLCCEKEDKCEGERI